MDNFYFSCADEAGSFLNVVMKQAEQDRDNNLIGHYQEISGLDKPHCITIGYTENAIVKIEFNNSVTVNSFLTKLRNFFIKK